MSPENTGIDSTRPLAQTPSVLISMAGLTGYHVTFNFHGRRLTEEHRYTSRMRRMAELRAPGVVAAVLTVAALILLIYKEEFGLRLTTPCFVICSARVQSLSRRGLTDPALSRLALTCDQ